jgi:hypothetical protein
MYSLSMPIDWPSSSGLGSTATGSEVGSRLFHDDKNACAGLADIWFGSPERREDRLDVDPMPGILEDREARRDLVLEFLLSGLLLS